MATVEHLIRYESAYSGLSFRRGIYRREEDAEAVIDCLALANAEVQGRRYLVLGVDDAAGEGQRLVGVDRHELERFGRRLLKLIDTAVEPALSVAVRGVELDGRLIGYVRIKDCVSQPYLAKRAIGKALQTGSGYIRRGACNHPLQRSDLARMFAPSRRARRPAAKIRVSFLGREPIEHLTLPALALNKLPSELAAERLRSLLAAQKLSRDAFGRSETRIERLSHARLYGMDVPFEKRSQESLVMALDRAECDYRAADEHHMYEVRAHKLNLLLVNETQRRLHRVAVHLRIPLVQGVGVAARVYTESEGKLPPDGYPLVSFGRRVVTLSADLDTVFGQRSVPVFREPARFWAREEAVGKSITVEYEVRASELKEPVRGNLVLSIDKAALENV